MSNIKQNHYQIKAKDNLCIILCLWIVCLKTDIEAVCCFNCLSELCWCMKRAFFLAVKTLMHFECCVLLLPPSLHCKKIGRFLLAGSFWINELVPLLILSLAFADSLTLSVNKEIFLMNYLLFSALRQSCHFCFLEVNDSKHEIWLFPELSKAVGIT